MGMGRELGPGLWPGPQTVENPPWGFSTVFLQSAARIICPPMANKFHTCSLRSIFVQVHALVENGFYFIRRYSGELCEALF